MLLLAVNSQTGCTLVESEVMDLGQYLHWECPTAFANVTSVRVQLEYSPGMF